MSIIAIFAILLLFITPMAIMAKAPDDKHMIGDNKRINKYCPMVREIPIKKPIMIVPNIPIIAPKEEPRILPITME